MIKGLSKTLLVGVVVASSWTPLSMEQADANCSEEDICRPPATAVHCDDEKRAGYDRLTDIVLYGGNNEGEIK